MRRDLQSRLAELGNANSVVNCVLSPHAASPQFYHRQANGLDVNGLDAPGNLRGDGLDQRRPSEVGIGPFKQIRRSALGDHHFCKPFSCLSRGQGPVQFTGCQRKVDGQTARLETRGGKSVPCLGTFLPR